MTSTNLWQGEQVRLRAVEPGDWEAYHRSNLDTEAARRHSEIPFPRSTEGQKKWAHELSLAEPKDDSYRLVIETRAGEIVGMISTAFCDRRNGTFQYGLGIFSEHRRKGYATDAIRLVLNYFFNELRYHKVTVYVYAFNEPSLNLHEKLGFQREGRLRQMIFTDGKLHDEILLGLTAEEFQGLGT